MLSDDELKYFGELLKRRERETMEQLLVCSDSAKPASLDHAIGRVTRNDAIQQLQVG